MLRTLRSLFFIAHYSLHTTQFWLSTAHYSTDLHTSPQTDAFLYAFSFQCSLLLTSHWILMLHCSRFILYFLLHSLSQCTLNFSLHILTVHFSLFYTPHCNSPHCSVLALHCSLHTLHYILPSPVFHSLLTSHPSKFIPHFWLFSLSIPYSSFLNLDYSLPVSNSKLFTSLCFTLLTVHS